MNKLTERLYCNWTDDAAFSNDCALLMIWRWLSECEREDAGAIMPFALHITATSRSAGVGSYSPYVWLPSIFQPFPFSNMQGDAFGCIGWMIFKSKCGSPRIGDV